MALGRKRRLNRDEIIRAYRELGTLRAAAKRVGCCHGQVWRVLRDAGVPIHPPCLHVGRRQPADASRYYFVYGTLKRGHRNNCLLKTSRFVGEATTASEFAMLEVGFPVVVNWHAAGAARVRGEVYAVDDPGVEDDLDRLEGVPHMYVRGTECVLVDSAEAPVNCFIYLGNPIKWKPLVERVQRAPWTRSKDGVLEWGRKMAGVDQ